MAKKILIYNKKLSAGGAERQLAALVKCLVDRGHTVDFLLDKKAGELLHVVEGYGANVSQCGFSGNLFTRSRQLRKFIKHGKYDVVVTFLPECNIVAALASLPCRKWKLVTGARSANPQFKSNLKLKIYYWLHLLSDAVITNSETNKNDIVQVTPFIKRDKIKVIYNLISIPSHEAGDTMPSSRLKIVVAANYRSVKNLLSVVEALSLLSMEERDKVKIDWYGLEIDDTLTRAKQRISELGISDVIALNPSTDKIAEKYYDADWVGLFSKFEGLPNALCEALLMGKPIICTPVSDMPILLDNTENIICSSSSPDSISKALRQFISVPKAKAKSIGCENKARFSTIFNNDKITEQLISTVLG